MSDNHLDGNSYIHLMVGLPGSGKSTWVKQEVINRFRHSDTKPLVLSTDNLIEEEAKRLGKTYDEIFKYYIDTAQKKFNADLIDALRNKRDIVIDRTNLSKNSRARILDLVPEGYRKVAVVVMTDTETQNKRLLSRPGKKIPLRVLETMAKTYQEPTVEEGFNSINFFDSGKEF